MAPAGSLKEYGWVNNFFASNKTASTTTVNPMSNKGSIPSKPAYRSGRNAPTTRQKQWLSRQLQKFCEEPFPNGAEIIDDENKSCLINGVWCHHVS
jgi:hypothetical protein